MSICGGLSAVYQACVGEGQCRKSSQKEVIEFVRCYQEGNVGHAERKIVDTVEEIVEDRKENEEIQKISKNNFESTPFSARQLRCAISQLTSSNCRTLP
jgi:hypothetical protein